MTFQEHRSARMRRQEEEKVCEEVMTKMGKAHILPRPRRCMNCGWVGDIEDLVNIKSPPDSLAPNAFVCPRCQNGRRECEATVAS